MNVNQLLILFLGSGSCWVHIDLVRHIYVFSYHLGEISQLISLQSPIHNILHCNDELVYLQAETSITELKLLPKHPLYYSSPFLITSLYYDSSNIFITMTNGIVFIFDASTGCVSNFLCIHSEYGSINKVIPLLQLGIILVLTSQGRIILGNTKLFPISIYHIFTGILICYSRTLNCFLV